MATDLDKVRLLISDVGGQDGNSFLFTDGDINTFFEMEPSVFRCAALALRTIASNEAQVSKRITFLELKTDGPAVAKELRELATELETKADAYEDTSFETADMGRDFLSRRVLRGISSA